MTLGSWKSISSIPGTSCPDNVVSGTDSSSIAGTCARTMATSSNGLISYLCDSFFVTANYICQKPNEGDEGMKWNSVKFYNMSEYLD